VSQENNVVVIPVEHGGPSRRSRNFEERLMVRFPSLYRRLSALVFGFSPRSLLRRAFVRRAVVSGWAAFARRDFELMLVRFAPDVEVEFQPGLQTLDLGGTYHGHEGLVEGLSKLFEVFDTSEAEPAYVLDLGNRFLNLVLVRSRARTSGVPLEQTVGQLLTVREGLVAREQSFFSWEEGMRAAGLDPNAITLPSRKRTTQTAGSAG
jgi:ketosteroid isomerase-like protein